MYEKVGKGPLHSGVRLVFLGRMLVSPVLFLGAHGYLAYLSDRQVFRSKVLAELRHIMTAASLDSTYYIEDWFMKKGRLLVHVARKAHRIKRELDSPWRKAASWLKRQSSQFQ